MKWKIAVATVLVILIVGSGVGIYLINQRNVNDLVERGERVNLLVLGLDYIEGATARRSDTMMLVSIDPEANEASLISIPRDLYVKYPEGKFRRVNAAYAIDGADLAVDMVSDFLGVPINFHLVIDYKGFKEIVDLIDGVEITVEERLQYTDEAAGLNIDIEPGTQLLTGEEALGYMRYRGNQSDLQRISRQQKFLQALLQSGIQLKGWSQIKGLIDTGRKYTKTNLSLMDMYDLAKTVKDLEMEDFNMKTLPGVSARIDNKSVLLPEIVETRRVIASEINGLGLFGNSDVSPYILNGEGSNYLARMTADKLGSEGFAVAGTDNADRFDYETSYIVTLKDDATKAAQMLKGKLPYQVEIVSESEFQDNLTAIEESGVNIPSEANLLLVLGKGSPSFVT
ncbi:MAG: LCP family protein [Candidatus Acetothermia bacterium]